MFDYVCVGGTFDRIHKGHEALLKECVKNCQKSLTVGVTDESMIANKILCELIQPCQTRISDVEAYLKKLKPDLEYKVVAISDPFGPSIVDEKLEAIIGSKETERGCLKVNEVRLQKNMSPLEIILVDLIQDEAHNEVEDEKVSSSSYRMRLLGTELKKPTKPWNREEGPYEIGLIGGSASGKTELGEKLAKFGAAIINCDQLGHQAYQPGTDCYRKVVAEFDNGSLVGPDGQIVRSVLGAMVFSDRSRLEKLNSIVWPEIWRMAKDQAKELWQGGKQVVVYDAAVLITAGWHKDMHQIFACIIDPRDACERIMLRDGKTLEEAQKRLKSQTANAELVSHANVVFCTKWSHDYTNSQVKRAWENLQKYLNSS